MSVVELVKELQARGVRVRVKGDQLVVQAAAGALTPELKDRIGRHKTELLAMLREATAQPKAQAPASLKGLADPAHPPLAPAQRRFWYLQRIDPASAIYNLPGIWRLKGPLDVARFRDALQAMVDRHDVLRSRFITRDGHPELEISDVRVDMPLKDFSHLPVAEREAAMGAFIEDVIEIPTDIEVGPPFRTIMMRLAPDEHAILWMPHSIVWDGWSFDLLLDEFSAHYLAAIEGRTEALPPLPIQFTDFAAWQTQRLERGEFDADLEYWRRRLAGPIPALDLPTDRERTPGVGYEGARVRARMDGALLESIRELARVEGVTSYMVLLAVVNALIHRYSAARDVLIASPLQGRLHPELENLIGLFVNTLFFRTRVEPDQSFRTLLHNVRDTCLEAVQHQDAPSDLVIEAMEEAGLRRTPYEMIFIYQQATARVTEMGQVNVASIGHGIRHVAVDLVMWAREHPNHLDFGFDFRTGLFDEARIKRMAGHVVAALGSVLRDVQTPVGELKILTDGEERELAAWSSGPGALAPLASRLHSECGLIVGGKPLQGKALREAADAITAIVQGSHQGVGGQGTSSGPVALLVDGSPESALALAVLSERNIATLLLTPGLSAGAIDDLCARTGARVVLAPPSAAVVLAGARTSRVGLSLSLSLSPSATAGLEQTAVGAEQGGVLVPVPSLSGGWVLVHRTWDAIRSDAAILRQSLGLTPASRVMLYPGDSPEQFGSASLAALGSGATLVLPDPALPPDGWDLEDLVSSGAVNQVIAGSRTLQQLAETGWQSRVGTVLCGDPLMSASLRGIVRERADRVVAGWGMSEAGTWAILAEQADLDAGALGRPAPGTVVHVADAYGQAVPVGVPGELWIGGPSVAQAISDAADDDRGRFATPLAARGRMFRTGERVRWTAEGRLVSDGHGLREAILDGRRVGLADVEAAIRLEPGIQDAYVTVQRIDGERRLAAFAVPKTGTSIAAAEIRARLKERLGAASVPDAIVEVRELARHDDGTIDEARLSSQLKEAVASRRHAEPRSVDERAVADAWKEALNVQRVGLADNFFELGGHSLLAVQVTLKLEEKARLRIDPRSLFFQTLEQVAAGATRTLDEKAPAVAS